MPEATPAAAPAPNPAPILADVPAAGPADAEAAHAEVERRARWRREGRAYLIEDLDKTIAAVLRANALVMWRRFGAIIVGLAAIGGAIWAWMAGYRQYLWMEGLAAAAGLVLIGWALLWLRRDKEGSLAEIEAGLDALREHDLANLIVKAEERLAFVGDTDLKQRLVLRGFPDRQRLPGAFFGGRIGTDGKARFTPVGVTVFALGKDTVAAFKGAIDLTTGDVLYERLVEFPYADIRSLELVVSTRGEGDGEAEAAAKKKGAMQTMAEVAARRGRARRPQKDKEVLVVHLSSAVRVETILSDRGFVDAWKGAALGAIAPMETEDHCRMVWQTLRERWRAALAR
jgi:hypothetical protein